MKKYFYLIVSALTIIPACYSQSTFPPVSVEYGTFLGESIALRDAETVEINNGDPANFPIIPNNLRNAPKSNVNALPLGPDPLAQTAEPFRSPQDILVNFPGVDVSEAGFVPPDPTGAAGPNHYVHAVNVVIKIFDKTGNILVGPVSLGSFLGSGNNNGDPIVMYDQLADRFFVSQFRISDNALIIGVSSTPDPTGTYNVYSFPLDAFPDYPHYTVWPSAYFLAANKFQGNVVYALDRAAMIAGDPAPAIIGFNLPGVVRNPNTVFGPQPANLLGTDIPADAPCYIVYLQDDSWSPVITFDHLKIWSISPDFVVPGGSTITIPAVIPVAPFDSTFNPFGVGDVSQPNTSQKISSQSGIISYMANYRSFPGHNSFLINFNTDVGAGRIGIRWYELRNVALGPFTIFQEGTWSRPDVDSRFMGSMGMDVDGNIALAYSVSSATTRPDIRFTGRLATDPLNQMSFEEQTIQAGVGSNFSNERFGDYSHMTMDPDGETFWFTSHYYRSNSAWRTKIAAFNLDNLPILGVPDVNINPLNAVVYPLHNGTYEVFVPNNDGLDNLQFQVIDMQGKQVHSNKLIGGSNGFRGTFPSSDMAQGVYLIKVYNSNTTSTVKAIVK